MALRELNPCLKTRPVNDPYEIWIVDHPDIGKIEYRILKKYQLPEKEKYNQYARWFTAAKSPATFGSYDMGDMYVHEIKEIGKKIDFDKNKIEKW